MATSTSGVFGDFGQVNCGAAKLGLVGLMNTLAIEGSRSNILVNANRPRSRDELSHSAGLYVVGRGRINGVQQFQNKGVASASTPTVAEIAAARRDEITDMSEAVPGKNPLGCTDADPAM